jgi:hypothetical protein
MNQLEANQHWKHHIQRYLFQKKGNSLFVWDLTLVSTLSRNHTLTDVTSPKWVRIHVSQSVRQAQPKQWCYIIVL